jgi:hypothetical protein
MSFFKKLVDTFTTNESRYNAERSRYIVKTLNSIAEIDPTTFPEGGKFRPVFIASLSPLHTLSNISSLDLRKTIQLFYLYALGHTNKDIRDYYDIHLSRIYDSIKSKDDSFSLSKNQFLDLAKQTAKYIDKIIEVGDISYYDAAVVVSHDLNFDEHGKYDSLFNSFYLFQGFALLVALPSFDNVMKIVDEFLAENNSREFKKFTDLSNIKLVNKINEKNIELGILNKKDIDVLNERINMQVIQSGFTAKFLIEWLILVFIYEGKSFEEANKMSKILITKLNDSDKDWEKISNIYLLYSNFLSIHEFERGKVLIEFVKNMAGLAYYRAE